MKGINVRKKLQISKNSIDQILASDIYTEYENLKNKIFEQDEYKQAIEIINNKDKFSTDEYNSAKLSIVKAQSALKPYRKELDEAFNQILKEHDK